VVEHQGLAAPPPVLRHRLGDGGRRWGRPARGALEELEL
jgi:hypothetical protein